VAPPVTTAAMLDSSFMDVNPPGGFKWPRRSAASARSV
jgi:hypothetical protein